MAKKRESIRLSAGEMAILQMLWEWGSVSLSEAHKAMSDRGVAVGYTTVQTRLDRLVEKGAVDKSTQRPARYRAAVAPDEVSGPLLDLLLERVSGAVPLVAHLLQDPSLSKDDLEEIKKLIAEAEQRQQEESGS